MRTLVFDIYRLTSSPSLIQLILRAFFDLPQAMVNIYSMYSRSVHILTKLDV
jgi:hypothetical protein